MKLHTLKPAEGYTKTAKRLGRGQGSGGGGTARRGHKGAQSRSGYSRKFGFEGGQMPLQRRVPKFGFNNIFRIEYAVVNLDQLQKFADEDKNLTTIDGAFLKSKGIISGKGKLVKVLGRGELKAKLEVKLNKFSDAAKAAIEKAGGTAVEVQ